ncbi:hypothetical protein [Cupriavidus sp. SW-Y-13]|uniref:hypothetical protein n=1 Tax=Cupriavidus sp. DL-D2 TaxID=3144974 RepID=UPI0013665A91|nr:hypothetical protein [Cupriavidus sp. SW-Y-13]
MAKRFDPLHALPHALWWQPGVYGSGPAVLLWIIARLPADMLAEAFGIPFAAALFNHAGDTVFVIGWTASAAWLWFTRKRPAPTPDVQAPTRAAADADAIASHTGHGAL